MELPDFLIEIASQISDEDNGCTSDPIFQVRCNRYVVTNPEYDCHHVRVYDDGECVWRSDMDSREDLKFFFEEEHGDWLSENGEWLTDCNYDIDSYSDFYDLPDNVSIIPVLAVDEVVSTHLTREDAEWFVERKQHDYPKLWIYVASAYWSPQIKQLREWLISIAPEKTG